MSDSPEQRSLLPPTPEAVFSPTAPIDARKLFAGRLEQVNSVVRAINQKGQHAIVYGERGVGKTSLANVLTEFLQLPNQPKNILSPRVNCDSTDDFESVWRKAFDEIEMHQKINQVGFGGEQKIQAISAAEILGDSVTPDSIRRSLTILSKSSRPILIFDEFDRLVQNVKRGVADTIKTLSDHAVSATVILVGVADSVDELIEEHESVERALVQVHMPRMSSQEIAEIINKGFAHLNLTIDEGTLRRVCTLAQGLPHYAHLLGLEAANIAIDGQLNRIDNEILGQAISQSIRDSQQSIRNAWHIATTSPRKDNLFSDVLLACALAETDDLGFFAAQNVRDPLCTILGRKVDIPNYAQHLSDFCDAKRGPILQRRGGKRRYRFRFRNPLMQPFVIMQGFDSSKIDDDVIMSLNVSQHS